MNKREAPEQFEIEEKKYSIIGTYPVREFLHLFIDESFPGTAAYIVITKETDRPATPIFYDTVAHKLESLLRYYSHDSVVAVYERMPVIKQPEKVCGNCKHFCTHYARSDDEISLLILHSGHCVGRKRIFDRKRDDQPKDGECFQWNAESAAILKLLSKEAK